MSVEVEGVEIAALARRAVNADRAPLLAALHGGGYTGRYFDLDGASLLDLGAALGYSVAAIDRPGYGASGPAIPGEDTFERQARLLGPAIAQIAVLLGADGVILVGHSIGGMIALEISADPPPALHLVGAATTGMGAVFPAAGGGAQALAAAASASGAEIIEFPPEEQDHAMFGPEGTYDPRMREAAHGAYAPAPAADPIAATHWPERLAQVAPRVRVPVQNLLGEFDALWDTSPASTARFAEQFTAAPFVETGIVRASGHAIDHHRVGRALHLRQIAFADECLVRPER
jgi:pimeloyl-ACP methyl ester carboxylesterase